MPIIIPPSDLANMQTPLTRPQILKLTLMLDPSAKRTETVAKAIDRLVAALSDRMGYASPNAAREILSSGFEVAQGKIHAALDFVEIPPAPAPVVELPPEPAPVVELPPEPEAAPKPPSPASKPKETPAKPKLTRNRRPTAEVAASLGRAREDIEIPKSALNGKQLFPLVATNTRRPKTYGAYALDIVIENPGITFEEFIRAGGRLKDLKWNIHYKFCEAR